MAFCSLSSHEALELQRSGKVPDCRQHEHVPASAAKALCDKGQAWLVARARIVLNNEKEWSGAPSAGYSVMQMVPVFRMKRREAGNNNTPCGKHRAPRCEKRVIYSQEMRAAL